MARLCFPFFRRTPPGIVTRLTMQVPWRPMTDDEWERVMHFMYSAHPGPGRPADHCRGAAVFGRMFPRRMFRPTLAGGVAA